MLTGRHTARRTDGHDELIVAFRNFANAPKSYKLLLQSDLLLADCSSVELRVVGWSNL